ncbi:uncharacterized protein LOC142228349 [Haematobia irritans]|uniref:uncharacterized protein LOC142228349 n=1 Tax=Haematobia irritans TaxID=7368 RepID=UPI003F5061DB
MDYQIVFKARSLIKILLILSTLHNVLAIVNRDLILTPKQGLQLSGKRIFYDENAYADATLPNSSNATNDTAVARPWERTLKHVTYLTLFTNAANGIITGNFSKVKEYNDFLQSPYMRSPKPIDSRFGDIVTLAQGRLETMANGQYRFVEGNCDYECARENNMVATWHVQKIRHRDLNRKFHYEMKFSVSPMTSATPSEIVVRGGPNKRTILENSKPNNIQTFIQKEHDYPNSFRKILTENEDDDFADRRQDGLRSIRQFNHQQQQHPSQVTPMPQPTFIRGVYRSPPPQPPSYPSTPILTNSPRPFPDQLNIGEYYKGAYVQKAAPKIELFPNLLTMMFGKPHLYQRPSPSTYRPPTVPAYQQTQFPRPDAYTKATQPNLFHHGQHHQEYNIPAVNPGFVHHQDFSKLPEYFPSQEHYLPKDPANALITHHYHHHFFMPNVTESNENSPNGENKPATTPVADVQIVTPQPLHFAHIYNGQQHNGHEQHFQLPQQQQQQQQFHKLPPAPQKFVFPITEIEQHRVIHVTPVPPLKKPQYQHYYQPLSQPQYTTTTMREPIAIFPAVVNGEREDIPTPRSHKPFEQSEQMAEDDNIRYSEPDPLYANVNENDQVQVSYGNVQENQGELPQHYGLQSEQEASTSEDTTNEHTESIEAQLPPPRKTANLQQSYEGYDNDEDNDHEQEVSTQQTQPSEQNASHSTTIKISTENSIDTEATNSATLATTSKTKVPPNRTKRVRVKVTKLTSSTTARPKVFSTRVTTEKDPTSTLPNSSSISTDITTATSSTTSKLNKQFVSTSTTETPLRAVSRYRKRLSISTTTTEKPVLKWKPRRKETNAKALNLKNFAQESNMALQNKGEEHKAKATIREVIKLKNFPSKSYWSTTEKQPDPSIEMATIDTPTSTTMATLMDDMASESPSTTSVSEVYEVLTQKSISYKVGEDGPEIPIIFNEAENEVKAQ